MDEEKLLNMKFETLYLLYLKKVQRKGQLKEDLDTLLCWYTGYTMSQFQTHMNMTLAMFIKQAPQINHNSLHVSGTICGVKVQLLEPGNMRQIRAMDKLVDDLAKGKGVAKILMAYQK